LIVARTSMTTDAPVNFPNEYARSISEAYARGNAARWFLQRDAFAQSLSESVRSWSANLAAAPSRLETEAYVATLHAEDLALACACKLGLAPAWEYFITNYRASLYEAARALTRDESRARELADSLYADLYGLEHGRRPLLSYFHGRSSLKTWLRAVLAQRWVDVVRAAQRIEPLGDAIEDEAGATTDPPEPDRVIYVESLAQALEAAFRLLKPRDRMRLKFYYVEELTLKEIGRIMNEHESSVSRRLARTRKQLRRQVERALRREKHLNDEQIRLCYTYSMESWAADLSRLLSSRSE
jgi:RNA polymerase sigma-70 factor, ECF subfamily